MSDFIDFLNSIVWSQWLIYLCLGVGLYFTVITRFLQIRYLPDMPKLLFGGKATKKGVSPFQAFSMAVSGRVGTGNIAGVATAIAMGGPGAIFWMWVIAFVGSGSAFVEATLAQIYKEEKDGQYRGGPAYYIEKGMKAKWYAVLFAIATIIGTGLCLPGIQANSIGIAVERAFSVDPLVTGSVVVVLMGIIIFGGIKRISRAAELIVPFMAMGYILIAIVVIVLHLQDIPAVFALILKSAFALEPAFGGVLGMAISWGIKRGIYSNEAGQGTAPMAAAAAEVKHPVQQGLVQAFSVYFDTWFVCSATALMILVTQSYNVVSPEGGFIVEHLPGIAEGPLFTQSAVDVVFPGFGSAFVALALFFFAFTTMMAYYFYTENNIAYLIPSNPKLRQTVFAVIKVSFLGVVLFGAVREASLAWALGDLGVGIMAWLNIIAIVILTRPAMRCLKDFETQRKQGKDPEFRGDEAGIQRAEFWSK
ncbi:MAG: alanine:cation symporter family protein [Opitutales bacterium]|nr:alanine:cation symporter family protein [Opitutales bacterium]